MQKVLENGAGEELLPMAECNRGENGNTGVGPVEFPAPSQALLKAAGFMALPGFESSVPQPVAGKL